MQLAFTGVADLFVSVHKKLPDNSYAEVDINPGSPTQGFVFLPDEEGPAANASAFYSSRDLNGALGIELVPGDYAIGFSWGPESIKFGRDSILYPRALEVGSTLGSISRVLAATEPPMSPTLASLTLFTGGAYAQQLCFVPARGACCQSSTQTCVEVFEEQCLGTGSFFHGQRTLCSETPCNFGACCFDCGLQVGFPARCEDGYAPDACKLAGGVEHWPGVTCPPSPPGDAALCPKITGACCNGVSCTLQCEAECLANQGTYRGDGSTCQPNFCQGACCSTSAGDCFNTTQISCTTFGGAFKGAGTLCETLPPNLECGGACCFGSATLSACSNVARRDLCRPDGSGFPPKIAYRGDNIACPQECGLIEDYNACCLPNGTCLNATQSVCTSHTVQGTFIAGLRCETLAPGQCSNQVARCCFNDGSCQQLTGNSCTIRSGTPVPGEFICTADACASFGGACCGGALGDCTVTTEATCDGVYRGDDSDCSNASTLCPGLGACCRSNGDCFDALSTTECQTIGGFYEDNGTACTTQIACDERGACCTGTGSCLFVDEAACIEINGEFKGMGLVCAGNVCKGGCCQGATCLVKTEEECFELEGNYFGDGSGCGTNACDTGACCRTVGTCENEISGGLCSSAGEVFHVEMLCVDVPPCVASGACCTDQSCTVTTPAACQGVYRGDGVLCAHDTCAATGACCNGTTCSIATQNACLSGGGQYKGNGVICGANTCPPTGACCNGTVCTTKTQSACVAGDGEYKGDNIICNANTCPAPVTGACCDGQVCSTTTPAACSGTYRGDGASCSPNPCEAAPLCTAIIDTVPANCAIDARRTHNPAIPSVPEGGNFIDLTFDCDTANQTLADYSVTVIATGTPPAAPTVSAVTPTGPTIKLNLNGPIPPGAWTCFTYTPANLTKCLGFLPGDANGGRAAVPSDILDIVDSLNGVRVPPLTLAQCDIDRSGICAPADLITEIDLLNGSNTFVVWNGKLLPVCPSAP